MNATLAAIGAERVGIRVSPFGVFNGTGAFDGVEAQYRSLAETLGKLGIAYLHLVDHSSMGAPVVPAAFKADLQKAFGRTFIPSGGFDSKSAEDALQEKRGDLVAFGRHMLADPDLVARLQSGDPLNAPDASTFYTQGPKCYTDYPALAAEAALAA